MDYLNDFRWRLMPKMLKGVSHRSMSTSALGCKVSAPFGLGKCYCNHCHVYLFGYQSSANQLLKICNG
jgi:hypothetical protein